MEQTDSNEEFPTLELPLDLNSGQIPFEVIRFFEKDLGDLVGQLFPNVRITSETPIVVNNRFYGITPKGKYCVYYDLSLLNETGNSFSNVGVLESDKHFYIS